SHLPKALGFAVALERRARLMGQTTDAISVCTFGDASSNHASAQTAFNAAGWCTQQNVPAPVLFVCEDNGFGISVRTPGGWIADNYKDRAGIEYFRGNGLNLASAYDAAHDAVEYVRTKRKPAFLHLDTVRLLGHAGSDVEQLYRTAEEIRAGEAADPMLHGAALMIDNGWMQPVDVLALYRQTRARLEAMAVDAVRRPKLTTRAEVMVPLNYTDPAVTEQDTRTSAANVDTERRMAAYKNRLPEAEERPRHLAVQLNRALLDILLERPEAVIFGEDVAKKGGVYHVTADLTKKLGVGRVFNTLLDETTILGFAIGAGHAGLLPIPEIQYLAYLMNAIDQLRGEAGSMQFFSNGQNTNPMDVRIAGLAYRKGFGGHFHNDNGIAAIREIPGMLIGCPARGADAVRMIRTLVANASALGRPSIQLEPIALYMTKDLHEPGDGLWLDSYPEPGESMRLGEVGVYGDGTDLTLATYANGLYMSLRVAKRLEQSHGFKIRIIDLRWLNPLPFEALTPHVKASGKLLVVDECRASSGIADTVVAEMVEAVPGTHVRRVVAPDCYIPLGDAANLVLVQEHDIEAGILAMLNPEAGQ
ncbi:MAG: MFS transporter, partial [Rhodobacterales bacterium]|nr:MFS transporter [Rhodobacterales bacterium]